MAIVQPTITYGAVVWANKASRYIQALDRVQRLAFLAMSHICCTTPTAGLEALMDAVPLDLYVQCLGAQVLFRLQGRNSVRWDGVGVGSLRGHLHWQRDVLQRMNLEDARPDSCFLRTWSRGYSVNIDSFDDGMPQEAQVSCYTDGSLMEGKSGWGYIIKDEGMEIQAFGSLGNCLSVFQAEIITITEAAKRLSLVKGKQISFWVDSQVALLALKAVEI